MADICPQCQYPYEDETCPNPACPRDKDDAQVALIQAAHAARMQREHYQRMHAGIGYALSFKRKKP